MAVQNDPNVAFVGNNDGFLLQNARIGVRGRYEDVAAFVFSIDGAVDERLRVNVPDGTLRVGMRDAYADVRIGGTNTVARAGFFPVLAEPQSLVPDIVRSFLDRPIESRGVRATEGYQTPGLSPGRSLGVAVRLDPIHWAVHPNEWGKRGGGAPRFGFELAIQNGADEYASTNNNDKPAVSASVLSRFGGDGWFVASVRYNPRSVGELPFRQDETDVQGSAGLHVAAGPAAIEVGGVVQRTTFPTTGGPVRNAFGGHAQLVLTARTDVPLEVGYRFGILDPSSLVTTDRVMEHAALGVLGIPRLRMRLQLQLTHAVEQAARALANSRVQLAAEVAL